MGGVIPRARACGFAFGLFSHERPNAGVSLVAGETVAPAQPLLEMLPALEGTDLVDAIEKGPFFCESTFSVDAEKAMAALFCLAAIAR